MSTNVNLSVAIFVFVSLIKNTFLDLFRNHFCLGVLRMSDVIFYGLALNLLFFLIFYQGRVCLVVPSLDNGGYLSILWDLGSYGLGLVMLCTSYT